MSIDQKKEHQKKRLAKQLRTNLMRRKAQARQRTEDGAEDEVLDGDAIESAEDDK
ncbi:hypothetical protein N5853_05500 [Bartonella sp. HY329]|uniref:hypothetical protein n=1 Tax=unclassified Bartonella TaxID=2645622 RepID=UPI0021C85EA8|nr:MULTISPECIES: hypothetical protein [unclassified Bartonella]UXM96074.1 hypothetical protein N5853_05500 [Bartonella sp. HY329]UXN10398.1 hypothetical protein N5852_05505 [Bartonella sp. HY328]